MPRTIFAIFLLFTTLLACKRKFSPEELKTELKSAMQNYLVHQKNYDPAIMKFQVTDVTYYEDIKVYDCEFNVKLTQNGHDTTGIMTGTVSKDFSIVHRKL